MRHDFDFDKAIRSGVKLAVAAILIGMFGLAFALIGVGVIIAEIVQ